MTTPSENPDDNSIKEFYPAVEEKFRVVEGDNLNDKMDLITKLVERTNKFLDAKDIPLTLTNNSQQLLVESLLSTITEKIEFLKYDFTYNNDI